MKRVLLLILLSFVSFIHINAQDLSASAVKIFKETLKNAQEGDSNAQVSAGYYYEEGIGTTIDYKEAYYWYKKAAEQNHPYGIGNLGCLYKYGKYVKQDLPKAIALLKEGGEKGDPDAYFELGDCYERGIGVPQSYEKAYTYYKKAPYYGKAIDAASRLEKQGYVTKQPIFDGYYTMTGVYKSGGQWFTTGITSLTYFRVYDDEMYEGRGTYAYYYVGNEMLDNMSFRRYGTNNDDYFLVTSDGLVRRVTAFSANYPMLGTVRTVNVNYYDRGDTRSVYTQNNNGSGSYSGSTSNSTSTGAGTHTCGLCDGKGWIPTDEGASNFGSTAEKWCNECKKYVVTNHWHKPCPSCGGKGYW